MRCRGMNCAQTCSPGSEMENAVEFLCGWAFSHVDVAEDEDGKMQRKLLKQELTSIAMPLLWLRRQLATGTWMATISRGLCQGSGAP